YSPSQNVNFDLTTLRVWDAARLGEALRAAEPAPHHQQWSAVQLDRYSVAGRVKLVAIAAAEAGGSNVPGGWLNQHVQYASGEGILACDAAAATAHGAPLILRGLAQFALSEPRVFYGAAAQSYALSAERAAGGVRLDSWWWRCAWAWRLRDLNLLLYRSPPAQTTRLLFRRAMTERAAALAPFLKTGGEPYPVVADGRLVWMLDLLTATASYPASLAPASLAAASRAGSGQPSNAARDSVKMVMDAADGRVTFYVASAAAAPLLQVWQRAWPQLVRPYAEMPAAIRRHRRYPRFLFDAQLRLLGRYHNAVAQSFHARQDVWSSAADADYALLPPWDERGRTSQFVLQDSLMPAGERRLAALLRAGCDEAAYGRLALLRFDKPGTPSLENRNRKRPAGPPELESAVASRLKRDFQRGGEFPGRQSGWRLEPGAVLPVAWPGVAGRVLLFESIYLVRTSDAPGSDVTASGTAGNRSDVKLWQVAVMDAATPDHPIASGSTPRLAVEQLQRIGAGPGAVPASDKVAAQIAALTAKALRLHDEAQAATARNWQQAGALWRQEREVLEKLAILSQSKG
ncbi:MAG TPA: UPF0182 family protein, partial [Abditibacteriaceae bacterium]|nr:UPF0182 family protein [Abditibacteriaceae bacterium]